MNNNHYLATITKSQKEKIRKFYTLPKKGIRVDYLGKKFILLPKVFMPYEDSQVLVKNWKINKGDEVLDIGTGCGVLAVFAADQGARKVMATDINPAAIKNTKQNIKLHNFSKIIYARRSNIFSGIKSTEKFDVIIANLPFRNKKAKNNVEASFWDTDFQAHKNLFKNAKKYLKPHGRIYTTQANYGALAETKKLAKKSGFKIKLIGKKIACKKPLKIFYAFIITI